MRDLTSQRRVVPVSHKPDRQAPAPPRKETRAEKHRAALALPLAVDTVGTLTLPGVGSFRVELCGVEFRNVGRERTLTAFASVKVKE